jgi:gas vesicle protein
MSTGKLVVGVLAGVAVGAIIGVLFAPDKGSETRRKIVKKGSDSYDGMKDKLGDLANSISSKASGMRGDLEKIFEDGKAKSDGKIDSKSAIS